MERRRAASREFCFAGRLHADAELCEELLPGNQAAALTGNFRGMIDGFAIADLWLMKLDIEVEVAEEPILDDLQVQLAHAR